MLTSGFALPVFPSLVLDLALALGLSGEAPDLVVLFGFTDNLGRLFHPVSRRAAPDRF